MEVMVTAVLCRFLSVVVFELLVVDRAWFPKDRLVGEAVTLWADSSALPNKTTRMRDQARPASLPAQEWQDCHIRRLPQDAVNR